MGKQEEKPSAETLLAPFSTAIGSIIKGATLGADGALSITELPASGVLVGQNSLSGCTKMMAKDFRAVIDADPDTVAAMSSDLAAQLRQQFYVEPCRMVTFPEVVGAESQPGEVPLDEDAGLTGESVATISTGAGIDTEDPWFWYIEPGIYEVCRLINDTEMGDTQFSCQGHLRCEKPKDEREAFDPYVAVWVSDAAAANALTEAIDGVEGENYHFTVEFDNRWSPAWCVYVHVHRHVDYFDRRRWRERKRALEQARAHLAEIFRSVLAPDAPHYACPGKRCDYYFEENLAGPNWPYSPGTGCLSDQVAEDAVVSFASGPVCVKRCPYYQHHTVPKEVGANG